MRILMVSHLYPSKTDDVYGSFVHSQVKALQEQGLEVKVMAPTAMAPFPLYKFKQKWRRFHDVPKRDNYQGVDVTYPRVIRTPGAVLFELSGINYYYALKELVLEQHRKQPFSLIHAQVAYPDGWAAAKLADELNLPLVLTLHGQELQKIVNWGKRLKSMVQATLKKAAAVVVVSPKMLALAQRNGVQESNLHLIYNGVHPMLNAELPDDIKQKIVGKKLLLSLCRLEPEKGIQHNLEAVKALATNHPNLVYIVVGDGPYKNSLQKLAQTLGIDDRVIFAGNQPREKVRAYYENSHVFSMPSRDESFGIVYLEAMMAGLPVIGTETEGIAPLLRENDIGRLVKHGDIQALAQSISELLDPQTAARLGGRGKELATEFTWQRNAGRMVEVYNSITSP